ncbi:MAG: energy-coupling factor ABC transporter ATP-binding protein [Chloroflexi bacterium]|nr:energy-coupling factor ABC transporter ATP-binding protein [Chloroflexota bacterium]
MSITVSHLSYTYRTRTEPALVDITAKFRPGEITLIAGASGCGKTTLVRCINGLIPHSYTNGMLEGTISLFGTSNAAMPMAQISQIVGTVLQDPERQIVASEVIHEISFGLENLGMPREEMLDRIHKVASFLHIDHLLHRETFQLSGGEKQKVALAGVLAMRPKALLLDEPLASLDPASGAEALTLMRELANSGIAMVIIEHRVEDVLAVKAEHCIYMANGRITYDGDAPGLMQAVNWREIKLPAPVVIERVRKEARSMPSEGMPESEAVPTGQHSDLKTRHSALGTRHSAPSTQPASPLIEFRNVHFQYGDGPEVLHDISFTMNSGDRIALLGPNGAGKTTLVKHAIGLNKPTRGQVLLAGRDSKTLSVAQIAHTVGYVFQSPSHMLFAPTVREELSFGPKNIGLDAQTITESISRALVAVNLPGYDEIPPLSMSFGQQKRISIASVLTMNPRVLVMDEPSAGQDYANYTHFMDDIVGRDKGPGMTDQSDLPASSSHSRAFEALLFITHDLDLAITYANRVLLVADGQLVADGADVNLATLAQTGRFLPAAELAPFTM